MIIIDFMENDTHVDNLHDNFQFFVISLYVPMLEYEIGSTTSWFHIKISLRTPERWFEIRGISQLVYGFDFPTVSREFAT